MGDYVENRGTFGQIRPLPQSQTVNFSAHPRTSLIIGGAVVAERLEPRTSRPEVPGSSPDPAVAPLGKALYPHCPVFRRRL